MTASHGCTSKSSQWALKPVMQSSLKLFALPFSFGFCQSVRIEVPHVSSSGVEEAEVFTVDG